ncbi:MAG: hypothetical protein KKA79_01025 [Nanoarchaeota archaeon]|nr:hypothetical protein [Nanoarchaeota archaeon]MCG2718164.1 hypothetical protein [Nanoarchaeota archaeon]
MDLHKKEAGIANKPSQNSQDILDDINQKYNITTQQLKQLIKQKEESIPLYIFDNEELSGLQFIVKYLKENKNLNYSKIARKINRNPKTIWTTYQHAKQRLPERFEEQETELSIPVNIFCDRKLSVLEHITRHLKEVYDLNYTEIAKLLRRSPKTIWTVYQRVNKKLG